MLPSGGRFMLRSTIVRLVALCTRHAWPTIALALVLATLCTVYSVQHFAVATDVKQLFPAELPWVQRAYQLLDTYPQHDVLAVVDAPTPELADVAAARLTGALAADTAHCRTAPRISLGASWRMAGPRARRSCAALSRSSRCSISMRCSRASPRPRRSPARRSG